MPPVVTPVLVPAAIMGVTLLLSWGAWFRRSQFSKGHWGGAVGLAGAYVSAHVLLKSWPAFPPARADDWQAWLAVALGIIGCTQRWWGLKWFIAIPLRIVVSGGVLALLLQSQIEFRWEGTEVWYWMSGLSAAAAVFWHSLESLAQRRPGASHPLGLWTLCALSAASFSLAGSAFFGQLAGGLAGAFGAALVLGWWSSGVTLSGGALSVFAPLYCGLVARGYFHAELPAFSAVLLYLAPFALWWGEMRRIVFQKPWKSVIIRAGLVALPAAVALLLTYVLVFRAAQDSGYAY